MLSIASRDLLFKTANIKGQRVDLVYFILFWLVLFRLQAWIKLLID